MKISLDVVLKDRPGQLVKLLEPISQKGGNIISIVHLRETVKEGRVPVHVSFEIKDSSTLEEILEEIEKRDIWVSKVGELSHKERYTMVLVGHIVDTDLRDTIDLIHEVEGAVVADVGLTMPDPDMESSARIVIDVHREVLENVLERVDEIARKKDLLVIRPLGV
ncbi:MAG: ACT domain-containing protein [Euryarchaeota archaeon]|nr:ACT domain-containing protein [Euryarchaeota archaeon]